ncbi:MAG TPA: ferritin-like domain-containing protein, partial [Acidimicrobiales bacterium]|nr:ferritin-like domain-containing protein [Acidimicrobiales bacterium]
MSGLPRRRLLGVLGGGIVAGALGTPARADAALDLRILQTASSLEALAEAAYARIPGEALAGFGAGAGRRHGEHKRAFQAQTTVLGGRVQDSPNPTFAPLLAADPIVAVTTIEKVLVDTYLGNLAMLADRRSKELVAAAMAVAAQHLA